MDSLAYGEPYGSSIVSQSTLKRTCSLSKFKGTNEISSSSSTASSSSFSSSSSEFVTVVEVDENLKKSRQQRFPLNECENNPSSMIMSTSTTPSVKQTTDIGSTMEPFVTVLEVGNQNRQTNGRDTGNIINNNNIVITTNGNHVNSHNENNGNNNNNDNKQLSTNLLERNIVNRYVKTKTLVEQVTVYRLPGERLGMTLKFDGGANLDETIENLYIQNINPDSPASRISGSVLGRLCEGDEILDIAGEPVNTMTRKECVAALGDAPICFKMLVKRQETVSIAETTPLQSSVDGTALPITQQTGEVDYHKATLRRVDSENALTPPMRTRRQPPPVPPRNSTTSLTSGNSFRSPIKPPARKRPSQPPPLPPRRAKDTTGKSVPVNRPPSDHQPVSLDGNNGSSGDTIIQTNTGYSSVSVDSHQIVSLVNSNGSSVIVDCSHKGLEPDLDMTLKSMQTLKENVKLPANNQLKINDVDFCDSQDLSSFDSSTMGTPYLNGTSEMIIQGIKTSDTKINRDKSSFVDKSRNLYEALIPAPPELYMDTVTPKANLGIESDSDDTGSSVSTIIERFSFTGNSCPSSDSSSNGSINNSFRLPVTGSNNVTSVPSSSSSSPSPSSTAITSNTSGNLYNSSFSSSLNHDLGKVLDPFEKLRREFDEKGSLEELIAEAKSGFSLGNLIHEKNEPRSNRSSSTDTSTSTTTINSNLLSANQSSFPCSILGPPTHQAPSPPIPSLPPLSPSRYEVNLDDYDDIQSISLTYEGNNNNSTPFCEPIVEPPKSFSNSFPIIREEGESSLEYDDVNGQKVTNKVDDNFIMSAADAAIAAADSVTLDAQEILSIVENMKLDEDLTLIPSIEESATVKHMNIGQQHEENENNLPKSPVNGHSPLSPSSSSASSSSTLPVTDVSITDGEEDKSGPSLLSLSGLSERKPINSYELNNVPGESKSILSPDETYTDHHHRMNGDRNGHVSRHSSICSNSSNDSSPSSSSLVSTSPPSSPSSSMISPYSASSSTSSSSPCSSDPRSSPGRLTRCSKFSNTRASTTGLSVNSLIPKMVESPNRSITSRSAGMLSRKSKSTLNLSSFADFDFKPSLIPRPITHNTKPTNITNGLNSLPRSHYNNCNGYIGSLNNGTGLNGKGNHHHNHHSNHNNHTNNHHHQQSTYMNGSNKNGSIIRRSKSIENMRSLAYSVSSISLSSSPSNGQDNGRRVVGGVDSFGRSKVKSKDQPLLFPSSINKNESAKKVESPSSLSFLPTQTNHTNHHHHNGSTINNNHFYNYNNHHQTNGQAKPVNNSCNNRKSSLVRCTERNLFNAEFTRSKSSLTSSGVNILSTSSSLLPSSSSSASSSSSSSSSPSSSASSTASSSSPPPSSFSSSSCLSATNGNHYNQYLNQGQGNFKSHQQQQQFHPLFNTNSHNRMVDLKLDLSDDEKDDIKELEELEEFIAREMKCKSESDDFLTDELFSDPLVNNNNGLNRKDNGNSNNSNNNNSLSINGTSNGCHEVDSILDKSLESSFSSSSKILGFPTIPEEQEEHQSLEMINGDNQQQEEQEQQQSNESTNIEINEISLQSEIKMNEEMKQINGTMVNGHNNHHNRHDQQTSLEDGNHEHDLNWTNNGDDDQEDQQKNTANSRVKYIVFTKIIDL